MIAGIDLRWIRRHDGVAFPWLVDLHRIAIELINPDEGEAIGKDRSVRQAWLEARGYRVIRMAVGDVESDVTAELDRLASTLLETR